jgi:hypothetical protein
MKTNLLFCGVLVAGHLCGAADVLSIKPSLLSPENGPDVVPALRLASKKEWNGQKPGKPHFHYAGYDLKSTLSTKAKHNDEPTTLDAKAGFRFSFDPVLGVTETFANRNTSAPQGATGRSETFRWGAISPELAFGFEADESMDNRQWAYGGKLNYSPSGLRRSDQWWMPFLWIDYRQVHELGSKVAEKLGVPRQEYWRFGSQVYWQIPLTFEGAGSASGKFTLVPGIQYYNSTDRELGIAGSDLADAYQYSLALEYDVPQKVSWSNKVPGFRLQVADGRVPPATENRTTFSIAVTVKWENLFK